VELYNLSVIGDSEFLDDSRCGGVNHVLGCWGPVKVCLAVGGKLLGWSESVEIVGKVSYDGTIGRQYDHILLLRKCSIDGHEDCERVDEGCDQSASMFVQQRFEGGQ
jgi:hypothetical protein